MFSLLTLLEVLALHCLVLSLAVLGSSLELATLVMHGSTTLIIVLTISASLICASSHAHVSSVLVAASILLLRVASLVLILVLLVSLVSPVVHHPHLSTSVHTAIHLAASPVVVIRTLTHWLVLLEPHVLLVAVLPLLRLHGQGLLLVGHWLLGLSQLFVSVGVVTLVTESTVFVCFVVSAPLRLVFFINF